MRLYGLSPGAKAKTHIWGACPVCGRLMRTTRTGMRIGTRVCFACRYKRGDYAGVLA